MLAQLKKLAQTANRPELTPATLDEASARFEQGLFRLVVMGEIKKGKSSLINTIVDRRQLARVSNTPGRTQLLNFFLVDGQFVICDLPGYGYAKVPRAIKAAWAPMIEGYLEGRTPLRAVLMLVDARRAPGAWEIALVHYCTTRGLALIPVVTKIDKVTKSQRFPTLSLIGKALGLPVELLVPFSALTREGIEPLQLRMRRILGLIE